MKYILVTTDGKFFSTWDENNNLVDGYATEFIQLANVFDGAENSIDDTFDYVVSKYPQLGIEEIRFI
jgi:hypothetical protein